MKRTMIALGFIVLLAIPVGLKAQDTALAVSINVGTTYSTDNKTVAAEFMIFKTFDGGTFELGIIGGTGKDDLDNSIGLTAGTFLIEGPTFDLGLLGGWEWTVSEDVDYITGSRGLYAAYLPPWPWSAKVYGLWQYDFPTPNGFSVAQDVVIDGTHKFGFGLSLPIR